MASRLWAAAGLNVLITCTEFVGGVFSGSVALIADAVHNLSDVFALVLAAVARSVGSRPPSLRHTYGLKRIEVLSAFLNAAILLLITAFIIREAVLRLLHPSPVKMALTLLIACVALFGNIASVLLLRRHNAHDLNVRSAFLHLVQDALSSFVVVVAAALAHTRLGPYLDPIAALVVGCASDLRGGVHYQGSGWHTARKYAQRGRHRRRSKQGRAAISASSLASRAYLGSRTGPTCFDSPPYSERCPAC